MAIRLDKLPPNVQEKILRQVEDGVDEAAKAKIEAARAEVAALKGKVVDYIESRPETEWARQSRAKRESILARIPMGGRINRALAPPPGTLVGVAHERRVRRFTLLWAIGWVAGFINGLAVGCGLG